MNLTDTINSLAHRFELTEEARKVSDFDAIFRAILNDILTNDDFDMILDDMIFKFARDLDETRFYYTEYSPLEENEIAYMIGEALGTVTG